MPNAKGQMGGGFVLQNEISGVLKGLAREWAGGFGDDGGGFLGGVGSYYERSRGWNYYITVRIIIKGNLEFLGGFTIGAP